MKSFKQNYQGLLTVAAVALTLTLASAGRSFGDDWGGHQRYYDRDGYWDGGHHYHGFEHYHGHRGYWDHRGGTRIWINI